MSSVRKPAMRDLIWRQKPMARTLTAGGLFAFCGAVYWYTIFAQKQETWQDIDDKGNPINKHKQY